MDGDGAGVGGTNGYGAVTVGTAKRHNGTDVVKGAAFTGVDEGNSEADVLCVDVFVMIAPKRNSDARGS